MDDGNLARPEPFGEVLGTPIKARHTADLGWCSAFAQQSGKSHLAVHPPTRATWVLKYQRMEKTPAKGSRLIRRRGAAGNPSRERSPATVRRTADRSFPGDSGCRPL